MSNDAAEGIKIVGACIAVAILYGILHDLVTANICVEYFSLFHPDIFHTDSPWLLALGWGVIATWWMGMFLGMLIAGAARTGRLPKMVWRDLLGPLGIVCGFSYIAALVAGVTGYYLVGDIPDWALRMSPRLFDAHLGPQRSRLFTADLFAHNASYAVSAFGAFVLCLWVVKKRLKLRKAISQSGWVV